MQRALKKSVCSFDNSVAGKVIDEFGHVHLRIHVHPHSCVIGAGAHARGAFYWGEVWQCEGIKAGGSQMSLARTSTLMSLPARLLLHMYTNIYMQVWVKYIPIHIHSLCLHGKRVRNWQTNIPTYNHVFPFYGSSY